jgi:hypothetical protein
MTLSGLDAVLRERAGDDSFTYAGYSAGACAYFVANETPFITLRDGEDYIGKTGETPIGMGTGV